LSKVFIIAEAGVNHNGSIKLAKELIDVALDSGVDAVKFQTFKADNLVTQSAQKANYQKKTLDGESSQYEMLKMLELDMNAHNILFDYCTKRKIMFLSSPFDIESIDMLNEIGMSIFKIPSGEITNLPFLRHLGNLRKEIILSTGMSNLNDIDNALNLLIQSGVDKKRITLLHATTEYPCPIDEVNILAIQTLKQYFGVNVGYSDHSEGIEIPIAAAALGATVIEKHFTLDREMKGPDHMASIEPSDLKLMVKYIRNIEKAMGDGIKRPTKSELKNMEAVRKSIVASRSIKAGELFSSMNITVKRPGTGVSPMKWDEIIGRSAKRNFSVDELIEL
jgi:N,N'-diacetyllegionaminate synthase